MLHLRPQTDRSRPLGCALMWPGRWPKSVSMMSRSSMPALARPRCTASCRIAAPARVESSWQIAPHLWIVPRQTWLPDSCAARVNEVTLTRLRDTAAGFDFSIVCCSPVAWLTASIGQTCDGLVLVLAAEKTRRLVAAQVRDQLVKAQVPLLGTVLAGRRLPVPSGLYHRL